MTEYNIHPEITVRLESFKTDIKKYNLRADGSEYWAKKDVQRRIEAMSDSELADLVRYGEISVSCYRQR